MQCGFWVSDSWEQAHSTGEIPAPNRRSVALHLALVGLLEVAVQTDSSLRQASRSGLRP